MFIELKAAFNTINRNKMREWLKKINSTSKLRDVIGSVYNKVIGKVRMNGNYSRGFVLEKGIKQGDSLSPLLFIIFIKRIIK